MNATWQIVDKLIAEGYDVAVLSTTGMPQHKGRWGCAVAVTVVPPSAYRSRAVIR